MIDKLPDFFKFFTGLSNSAKVNVVLLMAVFAIGYWAYDEQSSLKKERDDYKEKYDKLYVRYTDYVDKNQTTQNKIKDDCSEKFKAYREKKDKEVAKLVDDYLVKYNDLLATYQHLIKKD